MKKATALILVLVAMIIVGIGTTALLQAMLSYAQMRIVTIENIKAQYLAEAGMQYAVWQLRNGDTIPNPTFPESVPQGWSVNITKDNEPEGSDSYEVSVIVQYPGI